MHPSELSDLCVSSSELYLQYLSQNNRGFDEIGVHEMGALDAQNRIWKFRLRSRIYDLESIRIRHTVTGLDLGPDDFKIREYDADTGVLIVTFEEAPRVFLNHVQACDVFIVSSLLFLIENVRDWFAINGAYLRLPDHPPNRELSNVDALDRPSPEQAEAISVAVNEPLSYIWGPPGTGKTKLVLTHAALSLALRGHRVAVFAPTNIALEQAMEGLLEGAARLRMERDLFLRLGAPSPRFAGKYPEVCEVQGLEKRIAEVREQISILDEVINYRRGRNALHSGESMLLILERIEKLLGDREEILCCLSTIRKEAAELDAELSRFTTKIVQFWTGVPSPKKREREQIGERQRSEEERLKQTDTQLDIVAEDFRRMQTDSPRLRVVQGQFNPRTWETARTSVQAILSETRDWLAVREALAMPYRGDSMEELHSRKGEKESELGRLQRLSVSERMTYCRVTGMTLDALIGRFRETPPSFDHLFLDEAGYASFIKSLSLFRHGSPVTMLGDHKQLPPIVEMNDEDFDSEQYQSVRLWGSSAVYVETAFRPEWTRNELIGALIATQQGEEPPSCHTRRVHLLTSRRFGSNLCAILDDLFYQFGFQSAHVEDLDIRFVHARRTAENPGRRKAPEEVEAIANLLTRGMLAEDFAIITPYRAQQGLLGMAMPELRHQDRVLTIHKSQGREWDTVIVSVVDSSRGQRPWFTDTNNPESGGHQVMNTAVSRARKRLVIVCEESFWRNHRDRDNQLISRLHDVASPF